MSIVDDALYTAPVAAAKRTVRLPRPGSGQLLRVTIVLVVCCAVVAVALVLLWLSSWSMDGLPDIGGPEEIAAVRAVGAGDDRDAITA
jgi:hypothetical protein